MKKLLFICSRNRLRSPTAEAVFSKWPNVEAMSAGLNPDAELRVSVEMIEWADAIFVMEPAHKKKLSKQFNGPLKGKQVIILGIPDEYEYMQKELVQLLEAKVPRYLNTPGDFVPLVC
ncbi:MAG: phosphotyrosine protein phosphatase [Candidatus Manganitrophaceae bacterium]|nr:MAG: phosphotyrosine protein phosphatase [Candidatus Manganitrophaceae bacterium]